MPGRDGQDPVPCPATLLVQDTGATVGDWAAARAPRDPSQEFIRDVPAYRAFLAEHQLAARPLPPTPFHPRRAPESLPLKP